MHSIFSRVSQKLPLKGGEENLFRFHLCMIRKFDREKKERTFSLSLHCSFNTFSCQSKRRPEKEKRGVRPTFCEAVSETLHITTREREKAITNTGASCFKPPGFQDWLVSAAAAAAAILPQRLVHLVFSLPEASSGSRQSF